MTDLVIECNNYKENCIGNLDSIERNNAFYCYEGHVGALCEDCDLYQDHWNNSQYAQV